MSVPARSGSPVAGRVDGGGGGSGRFDTHPHRQIGSGGELSFTRPPSIGRWVRRPLALPGWRPRRRLTSPTRTFNRRVDEKVVLRRLDRCFRVARWLLVTLRSLWIVVAGYLVYDAQSTPATLRPRCVGWPMLLGETSIRSISPLSRPTSRSGAPSCRRLDDPSCRLLSASSDRCQSSDANSPRQEP